MFAHRKISAAARGVASFGEDVFPHREHNAEMASRSAITDGRLSLFSFLMSNLMGIRYIDNIDRQLITANNLLKKFHDLLSLGYQGNRSADVKSMHLAAERCAFELFQSGYPTVTMLQLLVPKDSVTNFIHLSQQLPIRGTISPHAERITLSKKYESIRRKLYSKRDPGLDAC